MAAAIFRRQLTPILIMLLSNSNIAHSEECAGHVSRLLRRQNRVPGKINTVYDLLTNCFFS